MDIIPFLKFPITSFLFTVLLLPVMIRLLEKYQILDVPESRKVHQMHTPSMGGVVVFLGFVFAVLLWWPQEVMADFRLFLGAVVLMFIIGLKDDIIPLKPWQKLVSQFIPIGILMFAPLGLIDSMYGFLGIQDISLAVAIPLTFFSMVVIVNSINLIDGADGLASSISVTSILLMGLWFFYIGNDSLSILAWSFGGAVIGFLIFNWEPAKIFMGDTGALVLGLVLAFLIVQFLNVNAGLSDEDPLKLNAITSSLSLGFVPLFDTLRVFVIRLINGKSPFQADKNHIHHIFMRMGFSHARIAMILAGTNFLFIALGFISRSFSEEVGLLILLSGALFFSFLIEFMLIKSGAGSVHGRAGIMRIMKSSKSERSKAS